MTTYDELATLDQTTLLVLAQVGARYLANAPLGRDDAPIIDSPKAAYLLFRDMESLEQEELRVAVVDVKNRVLRVLTVARGGLRSTTVRLADMFREAVRSNASALIVAHNHPSGDPTPSPEDVSITKKMVQAGELLDVKVLDHLVIGRSGKWVSMKERFRWEWGGDE